jgi:hypothetical protein
MKKLLFLSLIFTALYISCTDDDDDCSLFNCINGGTYEGNLNVKVTINEENPNAVVVLYKGRIEQGDTLLIDTLSENSKTYEMAPEFYYSGTVTYKDGIRQVEVVNGKYMDLAGEDCDCPHGRSISLNLRLAN